MTNLIIYHAYLPSFLQKLKDISSKISYLKSLNINCIWLNPIYTSGGKDCGYDITNYFQIENKYGNLGNLKKLVKELHNENIKIIMDLVINHTSDKHTWFEKSKNRIEPYSDYYIWRDKDKLNNKFISSFEKEPWTFCETRKQYYYHFYYKEQPDLNLKNPLVVKEIRKIIKWWINLGIDGFRMDAVSAYIPNEKTGQQRNTKETFKFVNDIRNYINKVFNDDIILLAETYLGDLKMAKNYYKSVDFVMNSRVTSIDKLDPNKFKKELKNWYNVSKSCNRTPLFFYYSHDLKRQRYGEKNEYIAKLMAALLLVQNGAKIIYYGQEINMKQGHNIGIDTMGRDGQRTPMQWIDKYENIKNWIPINNDFQVNNVKNQNKYKDSILNWYRFMSNFQKNIVVANNFSCKKDLLSYNFEKVDQENNLEYYKIILNLGDDHHSFKISGQIIKRSYDNISNKNTIYPYEVIIILINK